MVWIDEVNIYIHIDVDECLCVACFCFEFNEISIERVLRKNVHTGNIYIFIYI